MSDGTPQGSEISSSVRNWLIGATLFVAAAIVFGILYLFVIAPAIPSGGVGWFLFSFATGLTMIIMPCTLPLAFVIVPLSMGKGLIRGLSIAIAFGVGVAFTLSLYGVVAAIVGNAVLDTLGTNMETFKNWVYFVAGTFAFLFALSEIGLLNFHMPTYSGAAPAFIQKQQEVIKAFLLGMFLGNVGVGCPHPATPLILIEIATSGDILYGWLMFLVHAIGRILPLLLLSFLAILGVNGLNWLMARKAMLERVTGWAMVYVAGFILTLGVFSHSWWVNSGIHSALEALTQESRFNTLMNDTLGTSVAHVHGLETGVGLFGQPLHWGHWFLVIVWLIPMWWWYAKRRREMHESPAFKLRALEAEIDRLEKERRTIETTVKLDDVETQYDLSAAQAEIDKLEALRREEESRAAFGETGPYKDPVARDYEEKILSMRRNYLVVISIFLVLTFAYLLPKNFYYKAMSGLDSHGAAHSHGTATTTTPILAKTPFTTDTSNLPEAVSPAFVTLQDGDTYMVTASYVKKQVGNHTLRMLAYNGSVPGPFIRVKQGGTAYIVFTNNTDIDQTLHSHGLRLNNLYDGTPDVTQNVVRPGETYTYTLAFPDAGIAWYHPHTRDDYGQEMGLYGNYFIDSTDPDYYSPVNRELPLVLDDILIENGKISSFYKDYVDHTLLGRFGNTFLVNGEMDYTLSVTKGEVIRFLTTNVSNARTYRLSIPGALIKRVGGDTSRYEEETFEEELILSPAERVVFEVYFKEAGTFKLLNTEKNKIVEIARFISKEDTLQNSYTDEFLSARKDLALSEEFKRIRAQYMDTPPDKKLRLTVQLTGAIDHSAHSHSMTTGGDGMAAHDHNAMMNMSGTGNSMMTPSIDSIQWNDDTNSDVVNTTSNVAWQIIDEATGMSGMSIPLKDWTFKQGSFVKIHITNDMMAAHVMQHPIHLHGQRFVVLKENGVPNTNMVWKDTALVLPGGTMDILVDMSNTGEWMLHCHISEHLHAGMMMSFRVEDKNGYAQGDEYRKPRGEMNLGGSMGMSGMGGTSVTPTVSDPNAPKPQGDYTWSTPVADTNVISTDRPKYKVNTQEYIGFSFKDAQGNPLVLDASRNVAFVVTFVSADGKDHFVSYPGNALIHTRGNMMPGTNVPGTPGFDESKPHMHSLNLIPVAYADAGHAHTPGQVPANFAPTYSIPAYFVTQGTYKAFVEYYLAGDPKPFIGSVTFEVGPASWSIKNYGWSDTKRKTILGIISLILMVPLSLFVRRYITKPI